MTAVELVPKPLTAEAFAGFGDVVETQGHQPRLINDGITERYHDLANIDVGDQAGRAIVSVFSSQPIELPFEVKKLERHPLGSQCFIPLQHQPFLIVVAPRGPVVHSRDVTAFISNGSQGVNYHKDVWHHYQLSLQTTCDYLVIDRGGEGHNCDEIELSQPLMLMPTL